MNLYSFTTKMACNYGVVEEGIYAQFDVCTHIYIYWDLYEEGEEELIYEWGTQVLEFRKLLLICVKGFGR